MSKRALTDADLEPYGGDRGPCAVCTSCRMVKRGHPEYTGYCIYGGPYKGYSAAPGYAESWAKAGTA